MVGGVVLEFVFDSRTVGRIGNGSLYGQEWRCAFGVVCCGSDSVFGQSVDTGDFAAEDDTQTSQRKSPANEGRGCGGYFVFLGLVAAAFGVYFIIGIRQGDLLAGDTL